MTSLMGLSTDSLNYQKPISCNQALNQWAFWGTLYIKHRELHLSPNFHSLLMSTNNNSFFFFSTRALTFSWWVFLRNRVFETIFLGWLQTSLLISASWVARITGVSHQCPAKWFLFNRQIHVHTSVRTHSHTHFTFLYIDEIILETLF
jgi:hypothetical protein